MDRPKLRKVDRLPHGPDPSWLVLRDPLELSEPCVVERALEPYLDLMDGTRTPAQICQSLRFRGEGGVAHEDLAGFVADLEEAGLLDSARFRSMFADTLARFLDDPVRPPRLAGVLYPDDPTELAATWRGIAGSPPPLAEPTTLRAVIVPHTPVDLAAPTWAAVGPRLALPRRCELVVALAPARRAGRAPYAITQRRYATPLGELPTADDLIARLQHRVPWILHEEIRHRTETSLELGLQGLSWALGGSACPPVLPLLCDRRVLDEAAHEDTMALVSTLRELLAGVDVLFWVCAELSHVGPGYGRPPVDARELEERRAIDDACLVALARGDRATLAKLGRLDLPQGPPSGIPPLVTLVDLLPHPVRVALAHYELTEMPGPQPSWAGHCGALVYDRGDVAQEPG